FASAVTGGFLRPERLTVGTNAFATFDSAVARSGGTSGAGTGGQMVTYTLSYRQPWLVGGLVPLVTGLGEMTYSATLTVKNEPFENEAC
ncbi:MAG: hypothetical protein K2X74_12020, partial [Acetobacteraceae bacterium]|nr:hypothetical protein [Acetobacteraceae bacterium]